MKTYVVLLLLVCSAFSSFEHLMETEIVCTNNCLYFYEVILLIHESYLSNQIKALVYGFSITKI